MFLNNSNTKKTISTSSLDNLVDFFTLLIEIDQELNKQSNETQSDRNPDSSN